MSGGLFITGTDTGIGKTVIARLIVRSLVASGVRVAVMKPVAAGGIMTAQGLRNEDALGLIADCNVVMPYASVNPYCLSAPVSPHLAARDTGVSIELPTLRQQFDTLAAAADVVIVEGAGGWLAPLNDHQFVADLAVALELPVVLVVGLRLGCLNHALLSAQAIRQRGASLAGWIGNQIDAGFARLPENVSTLAQHLGMPPIAIVAHASHRHEAGRLADTAVATLMHAATPKQLT